MYWTTLEISAPRCALMCYPSSNITYCIACLLCIGVILLNKFNSIQMSDIALNQSINQLFYLQTHNLNKGDISRLQTNLKLTVLSNTKLRHF